MAKKIFASRIAGLRQLQETQGGENRFGADYQPASGFSAKDQPKISRPSAIILAKIPGRDMIAQSKQERPPLLLAAYHPHVFDIQELRMLSPVPRVHPLVGHPFADGWQYPPLRGSLDVADRLGILDRHPKLWWPEDQHGPGRWVPVPFVGDHLVFIKIDERPFVVNWTIKKDEKDFTRRAIRRGPKPRMSPPEPKEIQRHEIEMEYYLDAEIPTYRFTAKTISEELKANLEYFVTWHKRNLLNALECGVEDAVILRANLLVGQRWTMNAIVRHIASTYVLSEYDANIVVKRAIWNRKVRVDLFRRFRDDEPLWPETRDVLVVYRHLFAGYRP